MVEGLALAGAGDLVVTFGFSKLSAEGRTILAMREQAGYRTLLFTGRVYQEPEQQADINLYVCRGEANEYHSMTAPAFVVDALVLAVSAQLGDAAVRRLETIRRFKETYAP